jgi:hypothetical protein
VVNLSGKFVYAQRFELERKPIVRRLDLPPCCELCWERDDGAIFRKSRAVQFLEAGYPKDSDLGF